MHIYHAKRCLKTKQNYTSVSHALGLGAVNYFLTHDISTIQRDFILELLQNLLWPIIIFGVWGHIYKRRGWPWEPICSQYGQLPHDQMGGRYIFNDRWPELIFWRRFIDDILFIWDGIVIQCTFFFYKIWITMIGG